MGFLGVHWVIKLQFLDPSLGGGSQEMPLGVNERVARNSVQFPPGGYQVLAQPVHRLRESSRSPAEVGVKTALAGYRHRD